MKRIPLLLVSLVVGVALTVWLGRFIFVQGADESARAQAALLQDRAARSNVEAQPADDIETAVADPLPADKVNEDARPLTEVVVLQHANAQDTAATLKELFPGMGQFSFDARTNRLLIMVPQGR